VPGASPSVKAAPHFAQIVSEAESDAPHRGHVTDSVMRDVTTLAGRAGVSDTDGLWTCGRQNDCADRARVTFRARLNEDGAFYI
jgi:hypothetical protein